MRVFEDRQSFEQALWEEFGRRGYESDLTTDLIAEVPDACEVSPDRMPGDDLALAGPGAKWVIRNEHLDIINDLATGGGAAFLVPIFFTPAAPAVPFVQAAVGVGIAAVRALARFRKKIIRLTRQQAQVVLTLKHAHEPQKVQDLTIALNRAFNRHGLDRIEWHDAKTEDTLQSLEKVKTKIGDTESIVSCDENKRWRVIGI